MIIRYALWIFFAVVAFVAIAICYVSLLIATVLVGLFGYFIDVVSFVSR